MFLVEFPSSMRRLSRSFLWWLAGASLLLAVQREGRAQEPSRTSTIEGVVRDSSGTPVKGAGVTVEREGITSGATVYTGENGFYRLPSVAAGKVAVQAEREGFLRATSAPFEVAPGETRTLDLTLASASSANGGPAAPQFYDEPNFTVVGVADIASQGGHGSDTVSRTAQALAKEVTRSSRSFSDGSAHSAPDEPFWRAAVARNPESFEANQRLGVILENDGQAAESLRFLETARNLQPGDYPTALALARAYSATGQLAKARQTAGALLPAHETAEVHAVLGELEEKTGDAVRAVQDYQRAAELDPSEPNLFAWGAELLLHRALEPALQVFHKGARLHPGSQRMLVGLAVAQYASGSPAAAAQTLCRASDLDPANSAPYLVLGKMQALDPPGSSIVTDKMERFSRLHPQSALANYYYATSLQRQAPTQGDQLKRIAGLLTKSIELDPNFAPAYLQLGVLHEAQNRQSQSIADYQKAVALDPQLAQAHYRLAQAYRRAGDMTKAEQELVLSEQASKKNLQMADQDSQQIPQFVYTLRHPEAPSQ
jgi:tetratricopeptide (TPR) repeat protein